jgi:beta-galactosidase
MQKELLFLNKKYKMKKLICLLAVFASINNYAQEMELLKNWKFSTYDYGNAFATEFDDNNWQSVTVPHDWAVKEDFDFAHDIQLSTVVQDGEIKANFRTGRTGALPYVGVGWYRTNHTLTAKDLEQKVQLLFDGAMSNAKVYVNGQYAGERPSGYMSFYFDITEFLIPGNNVIAVRLENFSGQSRWYPGAGLYRKVSVVKTNKTHVKMWGTFVSTPKISKKSADVHLDLEVLGNGNYTVVNEIFNPKGISVEKKSKEININGEQKVTEDFKISKPNLWGLEAPNMYTLKTSILNKGEIIDSYTTPFGIRNIRFELDGFYLNDEKIRFKGVNMHHDFGPVGGAFHKELFVRQMKKMKEMGVNSIRFSHNPPAPEALDVCDAMGILAIDEAFDEWKIGKVLNGYSKHFDLWSKKDLTDMILRDRNHPSIIMWSIGNEIMEQYHADGVKVGQYLNDIVKTVDTTRATTAGFNNVNGSLKYGLAEVVDVAGFNYVPAVYHKIRENYPNLKFYASETGGSLSVRGAYKFPVSYENPADEFGRSINTVMYNDGYPGNDESTNVPWGYSPFKEFESQEYNPFVYGEFVWTGYDYLGEPSPYHFARSRSSYFAPVDMVGLPKDKFYLYQAEWNTNVNVLHAFPHWTWPELEEKEIPVVCYTSYPKAELFVNGKSYGIKTKIKQAVPDFLSPTMEVQKSGGTSLNQVKAHSIYWDNVTYEPGELKIVAYNDRNKKVDEIRIATAGETYTIKIESELPSIKNEEVGVYVVSVVDKDGNLCPHYNENMTIKVSGAAEFLASGNGDPTNMQNLSKPQRKFLNGQAVIYVQGNAIGNVVIETVSGNLQSTNDILKVE